MTAGAARDTRRAVLDALADADGGAGRDDTGSDDAGSNDTGSDDAGGSTGLSGPALADRLGISRAAVWKHVEALREAGFAIESTGDGYRVAGVPEYGGLAVEYGLDAPYTVEYHDAIPSTNDRARSLAESGATDVVVLADEQTGGRGRLDRAWESPPGGIWGSVLLRPALPAARVPVLTLAAAVAVTDAVSSAAGVEAGIKWPNDVVAGDPASTDRAGLKLAGVLTEMEGEAGRVDWVALGVGLNANVDAAALPETATSLRALAGRDVDRRAVVQMFLERLDDLAGDPAAVLEGWRSRERTLGRRVRVETPGGAVEGEAVDVAENGALVVDTGTERRTVYAGDCEHLRL